MYFHTDKLRLEDIYNHEYKNLKLENKNYISRDSLIRVSHTLALVNTMEIQFSRGNGLIPLTGITPPQFCAYYKSGPGFLMSYVAFPFCAH